MPKKPYGVWGSQPQLLYSVADSNVLFQAVMQALPNGSTSWAFKFTEVALATVALLNLLLIPLQLMPASFFEQYGQYLGNALVGMAVVSLLSGLICSSIWHRQEQNRVSNSPLLHAWLQGIIRYWLALSIAIYGFAKILKTQFQTPEYLLDVPLSRVEGMSLTWYYFGYSYTLSIIIASFQIGGSIFLLYRRTTLLGTMILLPVMVNIVLINLFYTITSGALFNSVLFSLALLFLLWIHRTRLKLIIWDMLNHLPLISLGSNWVKHGLRLFVIVVAFVAVKLVLVLHPYDHTLKGTWKVDKLIRNGQVQSNTAWLTDRAAWSRIYFAGYEGCAFSPNPYRFDPEESLLGSYTFDSLTNVLQVFFYSSDTLNAKVTYRGPETMHLQCILRRDSLEIQLSRLLR